LRSKLKYTFCLKRVKSRIRSSRSADLVEKVDAKKLDSRPADFMFEVSVIWGYWCRLLTEGGELLWILSFIITSHISLH
jgi:hypothetical protein